MSQTVLLSFIGVIALVLASACMVYVWTGKKRRHLTPKQFDVWCRKAYFGMSDAETDQADRIRNQGSKQPAA